MKIGDRIIVYVDQNDTLHPLRHENREIWAFRNDEHFDAVRVATWVSKGTGLDYMVAFVIPDDEETAYQNEGFDIGTLYDNQVHYMIAFI